MTLDISHIVPFDNENQWSDLLAVMIEADAGCVAALLGPEVRTGVVIVNREKVVNPHDRVDLLIEVNGCWRILIEVKILSGLGRTQLSRYREAFPGMAHYLVISPARLPVDISVDPDWRSVTWEALLGAFCSSSQPWVAETAQAWLTHLDNVMPKVDARTVWNDLAEGENLRLAMKARMSWIFGELRPPAQISLTLTQSSAGGSPVVKMSQSAAEPDYDIVVEAEERWPVYEWPKTVTALPAALLGPSIKVCLVQTHVDTSAGFDWNYLLKLWPAMEAARSDWVTASARPKAKHDKAAWELMVACGGPKFLGIGFGDAQAKKARDCMFGARFQLSPNHALGDVAKTMQEMTSLLQTLAAISPPSG